VGDRAVTIEQRDDHEAVVCYDTRSGSELWRNTYRARFYETLGGEGPRATPTIHQGRVYSLGAEGRLECLDLLSGELLWDTNVVTDNDVENVQWGMCGSPLVYDDLVVVNPGTQGGGSQSHALLALDRATGETIWKTGQGQTSYASPMLATLAGERIVLRFDATGLAGHDAETGQQLWHTQWKTQFDNNAAQPLLVGDDRIFITSDTGCALFQVTRDQDQWDIQQVWQTRSLKGSYASPVFYEGFVYGLDKGILACIDLEDGSRRWKKGRHGHGQILLSGDLMLVLGESGQLVLAEATPDEYRELGQIEAITGRTWNQHSLVDGIVYVRNHLEMAAYNLRE
jgi:outer membrane protein assembly factor BamB